jgi:hypothetical protein
MPKHQNQNDWPHSTARMRVRQELPVESFQNERRPRCGTSTSSPIILSKSLVCLSFYAQMTGDFRALTIVDVFMRDSLAIEVGQGLMSRRCGAYAESEFESARAAEVLVLRQWLGVHQPDHGPRGLIRTVCRSTIPGRASPPTMPTWNRSMVPCGAKC